MNYESIKAQLEQGKTPCGDKHEDGSGRGICFAPDGKGFVYKYSRTETGYTVTWYDTIPPT